MTFWDEYQIARHPERPSPRFYVEEICDEWFELHGDRIGKDDPAVFGCVARLGGRAIVVAALDRRPPTAGGFRKATRMIELAGRLGLPIVTFVDTPGADPGFESEYSGLAAAIARAFEALLTTPSPVVSIVTGEGGSGGALALACGDIVAIQEHAVFSVIAPEGAAQILHGDRSRAAEVAEQLRPGAHELKRLGLAEAILAEPPAGAHTDPAGAARTMGSWLAGALAEVTASPARRAARYERN